MRDLFRMTGDCISSTLGNTAEFTGVPLASLCGSQTHPSVKRRRCMMDSPYPCLGLQSFTACWYLETKGVGSRPSSIYSVFSFFPPLCLEIFQPKIKPHRQLHSATSFQKGRGKSRGWCPAALLASQQLQNFLLS